MCERALTACECQHIHYTQTCITHACWVNMKHVFQLVAAASRLHQRGRGRAIKAEGQIFCPTWRQGKTQTGGSFSFTAECASLCSDCDCWISLCHESVMFTVIYTSRRRDPLKAPKTLPLSLKYPHPLEFRIIFDNSADKLWTVVIGGAEVEGVFRSFP